MTRRRLWRLLAALALVPAWPWIWLADWCLYMGRPTEVPTLTPIPLEPPAGTVTWTAEDVRAAHLALDEWVKREQPPRHYH